MRGEEIILMSNKHDLFSFYLKERTLGPDEVDRSQVCEHTIG